MQGTTLPPRTSCWWHWQEIRALSWGQVRDLGQGCRMWDRNMGHLGDTDLAWAQGTRSRAHGGCYVGPTRAGPAVGAGQRMPPDDLPWPYVPQTLGTRMGAAARWVTEAGLPVWPLGWGVGKQPLQYA